MQNNCKKTDIKGIRKFLGLTFFLFAVTWLYSFLGYYSVTNGFPLDMYFWTSVGSSYGIVGIGFFGANSVEHITNKFKKEVQDNGDNTN